ncbi:MAG: DNA cytosine methyltransferase [Candidatus Hodarchaeota archaeon]
MKNIKSFDNFAEKLMLDGKRPWFVDLFAGCGGFSKGLLDAGWRHVAANEIWDPAADTYERNISENIIRGDIREEDVFKKLVETTKNKEPLVVVGGPPCQAYSMAGNRNPIDSRGHLWKKYVNFVDRVAPVAFVMENVKGLVSMKHLDEDLNQAILKDVQNAAKNIQRYKDLKRFNRQRDLSGEESVEFKQLKAIQKESRNKVEKNLSPLLPRIIKALSNAGPGYTIQYLVLNAAHYGVPQFRKRIFIIGFRKDVYKKINGSSEEIVFHPVPTHAEFKNGDPAIESKFTSLVKKENLKPFNVVQDAIGDLTGKPENCVPNHVFMRSKPSFIKKIAKTEPGKTVYPHYSDAWYRLLPDQPARTVKENHGGVHCHPIEPRTLTPRELARLQSFTDDFIFLGKKSQVLVQIGNAVPPVLGKAIGNRLLKLLGFL